jgi:hypothetical protein
MSQETDNELERQIRRALQYLVRGLAYDKTDVLYQLLESKEPVADFDQLMGPFRMAETFLAEAVKSLDE